MSRVQSTFDPLLVVVGNTEYPYHEYRVPLSPASEIVYASNYLGFIVAQQQNSCHLRLLGPGAWDQHLVLVLGVAFLWPSADLPPVHTPHYCLINSGLKHKLIAGPFELSEYTTPTGRQAWQPGCHCSVSPPLSGTPIRNACKRCVCAETC